MDRNIRNNVESDMHNDDLIPDEKWWVKYRLWIIPLSAFALIGIGLVLFLIQIDEKMRERATGIKFDSVNWQKSNGYEYTYRNKMLSDLVASDTLKMLTREAIIKLLGEPTRTDGLYLFYRVNEQRVGSFILHASTLVIKLSDDGTANKIMIHE